MMKVSDLISRLSKYAGDLPVEIYDGPQDRCYRGDFSVDKHLMRSKDLGVDYTVVSIGLGSTEVVIEDDLLSVGSDINARSMG